MSTADLVRAMADHLAKHAPAGEPVTAWRY